MPALCMFDQDNRYCMICQYYLSCEAKKRFDREKAKKKGAPK